MRSRDRARTAALRAEVVALRSTVAALQAELAKLRADAAAAAETTETTVATDQHWVTLRMPLVKLALGDPDELTSGPDVAAALAAPDHGADTAETKIVLEPAAAMAPAPADHLAWRVLAGLPEGPLLDPRTDRDTEPCDPAAATAPTTTEHRRSA